MRLDPGMHIGVHLVSFGKSGVPFSNLVYCSSHVSMEWGGALLGLAKPMAIHGVLDLIGSLPGGYLLAIHQIHRWNRCNRSTQRSNMDLPRVLHICIFVHWPKIKKVTATYISSRKLCCKHYQKWHSCRETVPHSKLFPVSNRWQSAHDKVLPAKSSLPWVIKSTHDKFVSCVLSSSWQRLGKGIKKIKSNSTGPLVGRHGTPPLDLRARHHQHDQTSTRPPHAITRMPTRPSRHRTPPTARRCLTTTRNTRLPPLQPVGKNGGPRWERERDRGVHRGRRRRHLRWRKRSRTRAP
jgi:hypothetical protein